MLRRLRSRATICVLTGFIMLAGGSVRGDWFETFDGEQLDVPGWQFVPLPDVTKTFTNTILTDPNGSKYLSLDETTSEADLGSQFGAGYVDEVFTDVRVGAIVNVTGDASRAHHGLMARLTYIIDPDGSITGLAPGFVPLAVYVMHVNWENGPANLRIDIEKVVNVTNIMRNEEELGLDLYAPGLDHARSYYAELDVVGAGPVYVTGSIYEYKDGPLVARTATMVDTSGNDPWEDEGAGDEPFTNGVSGIFGQNQNETPPGYHTTFDDVFSSAGPAAVMPSPADGAIDVPIDASLSWMEAAFATSREVWFGKPGALEKIAPAPAGTAASVGPLEFNQTYEWRVDQIGPAGTVTGHTWSFTTGDSLDVEDFESYADTAALRAAWVDNITEAGLEYVELRSAPDNKSMRFTFSNQWTPYFTEATRTFTSPQDWTAHGVGVLSLFFIGEEENVEHPMYIILEDAAGQSLKVQHPFVWACESELWREWNVDLGQFAAAGVDLTAVKKITFGLGSGSDSGQAPDPEERDVMFIDSIRLRPAP